ncbi:regulator of RNase E activity RraA [Arthrobacter ginsengisoli]|uniref:Putative 4-hydroxy-4-methyl-2-oxoglutarate aldolase n=1 Tax=Arthrobacter ginsengisoli TaxID=1356565 RepID=A0ABU1UDK5_9MICC|nr:RraA family protein [Arthrobacter ginsengisoli]MDR7083267.1 regulator of RNase E activity RraA [Arthrobacter ginsengisoli]
MSNTLIKRLRALETPCVSDALDRLNIKGQCAGIMPLDNRFRLAGPAFTVKYVPADEHGRSVGDFIDDVAHGAVPVIDNGARLDATVWGDLMTTIASQRELGGTVIDGVCRDLDRALELDYPLFTQGRWMRTGKDRVRIEGIQVPVSIGGIIVNPGDLLLGDINGLVALPADRAEEIIEASEMIADAEESIRNEILAGSTLRDARARAGYHQLQTRR